MKRILSLAALLLASTAHSHSMSPISFGGKDKPLESITLSGVVSVPITVGSKTGKDFLITVDGEEIDRLYVAAGGKSKATIPVKLFEPNTVENHKICSIGLGETFNTKICTKVKAYWLVKK